MSDTLKLRKDLPESVKWQPSHIYASQEKWEEDFTFVKEQTQKLAACAGTLKNGRDAVLSALKLYAETGEHLSRLYVYTSTNLNSDNSDSFYQGLYARVSSLYAQFGAAVAFMQPELLKLPKKDLKAYAADPDFSDFDTMLKDVERMRPHTLSTEMETLIASAHEVLDAPGNIYDMLTDVDMSLGKVKDESGKLVELTHARFGSMLESKERTVRKAAYERMMKAYAAYGSTFAASYAANVKGDVFQARAHGYSSAREAALYPDDIPVSVYDNLLKAVHDAIPTLNAYCAMRKQAFDLPTVHMYDLYVPMAKDFDAKLSFDEAYDLLLEAVAPLGKDYQDVVREAKTAGWIDVYETPNKTTGAYSNGGAYGVHPYVLLNYRTELDGLLTLAHEMGHAMHSYFSNKTQPFAKSDYTIFVAEVASTCNEVLTIQYLRKKYAGNKAAQIALIGRLLEGFRTTVFRQTMFAEFEMKAHAMEEAGQPLTRESLSEMYYGLNKLYYGGGCRVDKVVENEWMRIPHFYRSFYVYKYATGFCAAVALADRVLNGGEEAVAAYRKFLTLGGSMSPIEELKVAGVDMSTPQPVESALDFFASLLADFSEMMG
ncbi:MAG: oligoendopeptidase F [Clostridia bacterium]|nr:oligoendopeptidase F [Clostridia bacterium]